MSAKNGKREDKSGIIGLVAAVFIVGFIGGMAGSRVMGSHAQAPRIVMLRGSDFIDAAMAKSGASPKAAEDAVRNMKETAERLARKGYVVLSESAVLAAPPGVALKPKTSAR